MKLATLLPSAAALLFTLAFSACQHTHKDQDTENALPNLLDDDKDGVINERDECKNTPLKAWVSSNGCAHWAVDDNFKEVAIFFGFDSSVVSNDDQGKLRQLVEYLRTNPNSFAVVEGHTSDIGDDAHNHQLQENRAQSIKEFLTQEGADATHIRLDHQGSHSKRVDEQHDQAAHTANQRVYIKTYHLVKSVTQRWNVMGDNSNAETDEK